MQETKWNFLLPFAKAHRTITPSITITEIAGKAIETYNLSLDKEQVRKIISKLLSEPDTSWTFPTNATFDPATVHHTPIKKPEESIYVGATHSPQSVHYNKPGTYLVLGCWHVPFHNKTLHAGVQQLISDLGGDLTGLVLNGDFLDCNSLSGHDKGKFTVTPGLTLTQEYEEGRKAIRELITDLPKDTAKFYLYGNHENRWDRYMADMQQAKTPLLSPRQGLQLDQLGFQTIESYSSGYLTLGAHLDILHGVYYSTHCAKTHIDRFRGSVLFAHTHRIQSYIEGRTGGFNIGWGGDVTSAAFNYADRGVKASWQNGFAIVNIDEQGNYFVQQIICINGHFYYNNKKY